LSDRLAPTDEGAIAAAIVAAAHAREPLAIMGNGTKSGMLRPVQAARSLSARNLTGITLYSPNELVISARAGTPLAEIEAVLADHGQHIIAEPPEIDGQTLGGVVATNSSGPRRIAWGAMRDHVLGIRVVTGSGEVIHSGGRVLKNVTGLDLCKLLCGSHGTLGVITEVTLKVLPAPEAVGTVVVAGVDAVAGIAALSVALGSPYGVSAAAWLPTEAAASIPGLADFGGPVALARIEDFTASVQYRTERLRGELGAARCEILDDGASRLAWRAIRNRAPLQATAADALWRLSVRPSTGPTVLGTLSDSIGARGYLDWGGGLVWIGGPATTAAHVAIEAAVSAAGGTWTLMHGPESLRTAVHVVPTEAEPLARISRRVKAALDPAGILNPGRLYSGL
jgi:glycolate oxidase FAD binding subunit